jgi:hypothetical protein
MMPRCLVGPTVKTHERCPGARQGSALQQRAAEGCGMTWAAFANPVAKPCKNRPERNAEISRFGVVMTVELPTKHHHSPAFSLVPWAGADAKVCEMRMVPGLDRKFVAQRKHPNATGFMRNLYKIAACQNRPRSILRPIS